MVYLAKKNGGVVHHTSLKALKEMDGIEKADLTISDEEFEAAGCLARLINNKIVIGKTAAEKKAEADEHRVFVIDEELENIDRKSSRSSRAVARAIAKGETPPAPDVAKLDEYEAQSSALREERSSLVNKPGVAE